MKILIFRENKNYLCMQKRSAIINIAPAEYSPHTLWLYISIKMCGYNLRVANNTTSKRNDQSFKCDTFTKWKRRKRKPYFCCIVYIYYGKSFLLYISTYIFICNSLIFQTMYLICNSKYVSCFLLLTLLREKIANYYCFLKYVLLWV